MKCIAILLLIQLAFCADKVPADMEIISHRLDIPLADHSALYKAMVLMATWPFLPVNQIRVLYRIEAETDDWQMSDVECLSSVYFEYHNDECPLEYLCKITGLGMMKMPNLGRDLSAIFREFSRRLQHHKDDSVSIRFDQVLSHTAKETKESKQKQKLTKLSSLRSSKMCVYYEKLNDTFRTNLSNESIQKLICIIYNHQIQGKLWTIQDIQKTTAASINTIYRQLFAVSAIEQMNQIYSDICFKLTTSDNCMSPMETVLSEFYYIVCELYDHEYIRFFSV